MILKLQKTTVLLTISIISTIIILVELFYLINFNTNPKKRFELKPDTIEESIVDNIPRYYFENKLWRPLPFNKLCTKLPNFLDLKFTNDYWQTQGTSKGTFQIFSAHLDQRFFTKNVRIITLFDFPIANSKFYCQFWYDNGKIRIVETETSLRIWHALWGGHFPGTLNPYLVTCKLPDKDIPISVSLVENPCQAATNNVRIIANKPQTVKKDFVVCVKGLFLPFEDKTHRLVEWIELLNILGADKIHFYEINVESKIKKLLKYYKERGLVDLTPISLVGASNTAFYQKYFLDRQVIPRYLQEVIPYTDCLYRHLHEFKYVVLIDIDEVIVPNSGNWSLLLLKYDNLNVSSYMARNVYFLDNQNHQHETFDDIPKFMHMLQHVFRARNYSNPGDYVKGFHDTEKVIALHNHFPVHCREYCTREEFKLEDAHLQHYRHDCVAEIKDCEQLRMDSVKDTRIWQFREELVKRVLKSLEELYELKDE